jgi:hypothetical protein
VKRRSTGGDDVQRTYAARFLEYWQDLPGSLRDAALDIPALPDDWRVLSRLGQGFCFLATALDKPVAGHWTRRKKPSVA